MVKYKIYQQINGRLVATGVQVKGIGVSGAGLFHILILDSVLDKQTGLFTGHVAEILTAHTTHGRLFNILRAEQTAGGIIHLLVKLGIVLPVGQQLGALKLDSAAVTGQ